MRKTEKTRYIFTKPSFMDMLKLQKRRKLTKVEKKTKEKNKSRSELLLAGFKLFGISRPSAE
jgi:uncharacterized protein YcgL (UPF0745 family)